MGHSKLSHLTPLRMSKPKFKIRRAFPQMGNVSSLPESNWKMAGPCLIITSKRIDLASCPSSPWWSINLFRISEDSRCFFQQKENSLFFYFKNLTYLIWQILKKLKNKNGITTRQKKKKKKKNPPPKKKKKKKKKKK